MDVGSLLLDNGIPAYRGRLRIAGPSLPRAAWLNVLAMACCVWGAYSETFGEDVVYIGEDVDRCTRIQGEVLDYNGREVVMKIPTGAERRFPAGRVLKVESSRSPEQQAGDQKFAGGDWQGALRDYLAAIPKDQRRWMKRQILVQIVWCYRNLDQDDLAGHYFLMLLADDPETPDFGCIPLAWVAREASPSLQTRAKDWLQNGSKPAMLLGASHLLATSLRSDALQRLNELRFDTDKRLASLAQAQLWRTQANAPAHAVAEWEKAVAAMPEKLRAGPYYLLGEALSRQLQHEQAALAFLRVPVLYPEQRQLAARCLSEAASATDRLGRQNDARLLRRELVQKYPESPEAGEAARLLR